MSKIETIQCSVVLCTRRRTELLSRCLASLAELDHPGYEIVVVDNTPGDADTRRAAGDWGARYVLEPREGLSRARNTGARAARGEDVAFIDDDAVADGSWLSRHTAALQDETLVATTGPFLPSPLGPSAERTHALAAGQDLGDEFFRVDRQTPGWFERANFGGIGRGTNMAFRRRLFDDGWGFREDIGYPYAVAGEEHYAFFELIRRGGAIAYIPDAVVHHPGPTTANEAKQRRLGILRSSTAYMAMLLVEEPGFRLVTLRYALQAIAGRPHSWRGATSGGRPATRIEMLRAAWAGPWLYLRNRRSTR